MLSMLLVLPALPPGVDNVTGGVYGIYITHPKPAVEEDRGRVLRQPRPEKGNDDNRDVSDNGAREGSEKRKMTKEDDLVRLFYQAPLPVTSLQAESVFYELGVQI